MVDKINPRLNLTISIGIIIFFIYLLLLLKTAWLSDDSYITFRTIDNFVNGYGLRWNIAERIQSFTHPLWLFLLSSFYFLTNEIYYTSLLVSIVISSLAVYILAFRMSVSYENMIVVLLAAIFSKAFLDYSTSGLENPLTNLLLIMFGYIYLKQDFKPTRTILLGLISSLLLVNRMDTILLVLPALVIEIIKLRGIKSYLTLLVSFSPFFLWEIFSIIYYGFPFPNTAYAKLNTGIDRNALLLQGVKYFIASFKLDPITLLLIISGIIISFFKKNRKFLPLTAGVIIYLVYIIWIGGDFMNGRFFSAPLVVVLIFLASLKIKSYNFFLTSVISIIIISFLGPYPTILGDKWPREGLLINEDGICDERVFYTTSASLLFAIKGEKMPSGNQVDSGRIAKTANSEFEIINNVGFFGYYSGSQCYILDNYALNDPLLARLPAEKNSRIGHFQRKLPNGYIETLIIGENKIENQHLAELYNKILIIIRGDLFASERFKTILEMNLGKYNYLIDNYLSSIKAKQ